METKIVELRVNLGKSEEELNNLTKGFKRADEAATKLDATFEEIYGDLQPLTSRMGEAEDRLYELALAGQQATQEYRDLLTSVANYRQTQIQTDQVVDAAATTLGQKLGGAAQIAATGVQGVTAGMALFGAESVDTEKALLQVQSAMAFADAIAGVSSLRGQFTILKLAIEGSSVATKANSAATAGAAIVQKLFTGGVATTTLGFKLLRGAIIATGIGALVVGVGLLIANFDKVKEVVFKLVPGLQNAGKAIMNIVNSVTDFIGVTSEAGRAIDKQKALAEKSLKQNERYLKLNEHVLSESRKKEIALTNEHFQRLIDGEVTKEQSLKIVREKAEIERRKKADELNKILAQKNKEDSEKAKAERVKQNEKQAAEDAKENERLRASGERSRQEYEDNEKLIADARKRNLDAGKTENQLKVEAEILDFEAKKQRLINANLSTEEIEAEHKRKLEGLELEYRSKESDAAVKATADAKANADAQIQIDKQLADSKIQNLQRGSQMLGQISELIGQNTAAGKVAAVAAATIDTYAAAQSAFKNAQLNPISIIGPSYPYIAAGLAITAGLKNVKSILSVKTPSGGGGASAPSSGGSSAPAAPNFNVVGTSGQNQIAQTLNREQPPVKAYVVAGEMTTQQALDRNIVSSASVG